MMINAICFTAQAAMGVVMLKKVNKIVELEGELKGWDSHEGAIFDKASVTLPLHGLINRIFRAGP